jgi:hypothetical protein
MEWLLCESSIEWQMSTLRTVSVPYNVSIRTE